MQTTVERSIDLTVPVSTAYNQWTQFESFPQFMESVTAVEQIDDELTEWRTDVNGIERTFIARITEQKNIRFGQSLTEMRNTSGI